MAAATVINLFVDTQNKQLVTAANSTSIYQLPDFFENNEITFNVVFLIPTGQFNTATPYASLNVSGIPFRMSIGAQPIGNGSITPAAIQTTWAWVAGPPPGTTVNVIGYYTGTLALNTVAMDNLIGTATSFTGILELNLVNTDSTYNTVLQDRVTVNAVLDSANTTVPTPASTYMTAAESIARFVSFSGLPNGALINMLSPSGTFKRTLGVDDNGTPIDIITHT